MEQLTNWGRLLAINTITATLVACHPQPPPVVDPVGRPGTCDEACTNLERLQCPGWDGSPGPDDAMGTADDVPCTPTCEEIGEIDPSFLAYQGCIADASDCDSADRCMENAR